MRKIGTSPTLVIFRKVLATSSLLAEGVMLV
jgi:hypothetical protein